MTARYPWYWAWRGWRASTWTFLLWSALLWRQIIPLLQDGDEGLLSSHDLAAGFILFWLLGVWFIVMARMLASTGRAPRPRHGGGPAGAILRAAAPFAAVALLAVILVGPTSLTVD